MEVKNENELIARFMGWRPSIDGDGWYAMNLAYYSVLLYDESWDWLMPVVEKIESLGYSTSIVKSHLDSTHDVVIEAGQAYHDSHYEVSKKEAVYNAVVEFIKWYNSTPKEGK